MKTIQEVRTIIDDALGKEARDTFDRYVEDLTCYVRSWSMLDLNTPLEVVKTKIEMVCKQIIIEAIKAFLAKKYTTKGVLHVNMTDDGIYDKNMRPLPEVSVIMAKQAEVIGFLVAQMTNEFCRGRDISKEIIDRMNRPIKKVGGETYSSEPSKEVLEVEILRLEKKLPNLTPEEGKQLSEYYAMLRADKEQ